MGYLVRGEIVIDVEEHHRDGSIDINTDADGIIDIMNENCITLEELIEMHPDTIDLPINNEKVKQFLNNCTYTECENFKRIIDSQMRTLYFDKLDEITELRDFYSNATPNVSGLHKPESHITN